MLSCNLLQVSAGMRMLPTGDSHLPETEDDSLSAEPTKKERGEAAAEGADGVIREFAGTVEATEEEDTAESTISKACASGVCTAAEDAAPFDSALTATSECESIAESLSRRVAESPSRRVAEPPSRRVAESPSLCNALQCQLAKLKLRSNDNESLNRT